MENRFTLSVPAIARFLVPTRTEITSALGTFHINDWMCVAGSASADGVGFNSLADLGRQAQSVVSVVKNAFSTIGNFFSGAASGIGKLFRGLFSSVVQDHNGDGVQLTPATEGNKFYDMAGDGYQHLTAWTAAGGWRHSSTGLLEIVFMRMMGHDILSALGIRIVFSPVGQVFTSICLK